MTGGRGQTPDLDFATRLELFHGLRLRKISREIELWRSGQFRIAEGRAVGKRAGQSIPAGGDVGPNRPQPFAGVIVRLLR